MPRGSLCVRLYARRWDAFRGQTALMSYRHRPLHAMTDAFTAASFRLAVISEPQAVPAARELFPDGYRLLVTRPNFLFFVLHAR